MARYTGPATRKSRRLGVDLVGDDQSFEKRPYPPGQHGRARIKESEYLLQLKEKQKARFMYGVMEKQFSRYYKEAKSATGKTGDALLQIPHRMAPVLAAESDMERVAQLLEDELRNALAELSRGEELQGA